MLPRHGCCGTVHQTCPECSYELIPERKEAGLEAGLAGAGMADEGGTEQELATVEKRRSVRAKRDKPDYYDALDYDSKRAKGGKVGGSPVK